MRGVGVGAARVAPGLSVSLVRWLCSAPLYSCNASKPDKEFSTAHFDPCALTPKHGSTLHIKRCASPSNRCHPIPTRQDSTEPYQHRRKAKCDFHDNSCRYFHSHPSTVHRISNADSVIAPVVADYAFTFTFTTGTPGT